MSNGNPGAIPAAIQAIPSGNNNNPAIVALQNRFYDIIKDLLGTESFAILFYFLFHWIEIV